MREKMPLDGLLVLDLSQFLSGPYAALRLADLGARVIKVERPDGGDSTLFHAINRGKESFAADLKNPADLAVLWRLIGRADVVIQNFRPGVIDRLGLGWQAVHEKHPRAVYASITGWGTEGPWVDLPGQDLLAQSRSGVTWLSGDADDGPVPFGLAVADMLAGATIVQGVLAALVRRGISGEGAHVETSLLEVLVDFQFEVLTTYLNDGNRLPQRAAEHNAHAYLAAPYGVYRTRDGWLALAMMPLAKLLPLLDLPELVPFAADPKRAFSERDAIKRLIADRLAGKTTKEWLAVLQPADIWCASVLQWPELLASEGFKVLDMLQTVTRPDDLRIATTRAPLRIDGVRPTTARAAPRIGEHTAALRAEFGL